MLDFIRGVVRPTLVWLGFVAYTILAILVALSVLVFGRPINTETWGIVTGWVALVSFMVGYYFKARDDK